MYDFPITQEGLSSLNSGGGSSKTTLKIQLQVLQSKLYKSVINKIYYTIL